MKQEKDAVSTYLGGSRIFLLLNVATGYCSRVAPYLLAIPNIIALTPKRKSAKKCTPQKIGVQKTSENMSIRGAYP